MFWGFCFRMLCTILLRMRVQALVRLLVGVLGKRQLNHARNDQWLSVPAPDRSNQIAVHLPNELQRYLFGTHCFTLAVIRAASEEFISHRDRHAEGSLIALRLTLRKGVEVSDLGGSK